MQGYRPGGKSESVDAQARQLTKAGCKKVFRDVHVSGAKTDRAQLRRVIEALEPGDVLMVTRLDRLARSTRDLLNTLAAITGKSRFPIVGRRMGRHHHIARRLMLTVFGGLAEVGDIITQFSASQVANTRITAIAAFDNVHPLAARPATVASPAIKVSN